MHPLTQQVLVNNIRDVWMRKKAVAQNGRLETPGGKRAGGSCSECVKHLQQLSNYGLLIDSGSPLSTLISVELSSVNED